jgi:hypothetical protein
MACTVRIGTNTLLQLSLNPITFYRPQSVYRQAIAKGTQSDKPTLFAPLRPFEEEVFESSLGKRDTVIYFHGNVSNALPPALRSPCDGILGM